MGIGDFLKYVAGEAAVIWQAALVFTAATLVVTGIAVAAVRWAYSTVISHKDARIATLETMIKLRDDQLSNKFQSTSPDEAKALIAALQDKISKLTPRRLSDTQKAAIIDAARVPATEAWSLTLSWNAMAADTEKYAQDFRECLSAAGWRVRGSRGIGGAPLEGLFLEVPNPGVLSSQAAALKRALEQAAIPFRLTQGKTREGLELHLGFRPD